MIYVLYGDDELSIAEAIDQHRENVGPEELRDVNITVLEGRDVSFEQLTATCDSVPFLSDKRLVIVRGLISQFERSNRGRPASRAGNSSTSGGRLGDWEGLAGYLQNVPPTTDLVFVDGRLGAANPLLVAVKSHAQVSTFPLPTGDGLNRWIQTRAARNDVEIEPSAVRALADTVGTDVRVLDQEIQKLALFANGQIVRKEHVDELVSYARAASIFVTVDAVLEGRTGQAISSTHQLLEDGQPATYIITMIARQVRLLLLAKDLRARRVPPPELSKRMGVSGYPFQKTMEQERRFNMDRLIFIHQCLLEADLALKSTGADEQLILDLLIADIAASRAPSVR